MTGSVGLSHEQPPRAHIVEAPVIVAVHEPLPRVELFGLSFVDAPHERSVARHLLLELAASDPVEQGLPVVVTPNVHHLVCLDRAEHGIEHELCRRARYVLPDGQPVVVAGRLLGRPLRSRLAGSTLFEHLWPELCATGRPTLVVAPSAVVAEVLAEQHPNVTVHTAPVFAADDDEAVERVATACVELAEVSPPDVVVVGLGHPKQERVAARLIERWSEVGRPPPLVLCVGASLEFQAGVRRRAPRWMQRAGLEWLFRFAQEPRRLFRRYFVEDLAFVRIVWRERRRVAA